MNELFAAAVADRATRGNCLRFRPSSRGHTTNGCSAPSPMPVSVNQGKESNEDIDRHVGAPSLSIVALRRLHGWRAETTATTAATTTTTAA